MDKPQVICLTPVKNEAWILERFLKCASIWADRIIIADQGSDDGSQEIAQRFPKVTLIQNQSGAFNEPDRQKLLIEAARRFGGPNLLIALDADEFLTANFSTSKEWDLILRAIPGTIINFQWACILPDCKSYYLYPTEFPLGFLDNGAAHEGLPIHSPRLPLPENSPRISLREIKVMHLSTMDFRRFESKVRWYQCWEFLQHRWDGKLVDMYRQYHRDFCIPTAATRKLPNEWLEAYGPGVNVTYVPHQEYYRWDEAMLDLFLKHGTKKFRKISVWDHDWNQMHKLVKGQPAPVSLKDPRSRTERWVHSWLERTQPFYSHYGPGRSILARAQHRILEKGLRYLGW